MTTACGVEWPSGYGPPPEPPPADNRLRNRFEACRNGMQELQALRQKHAQMIQNLRSRLPIIPGSLDDVQTREKKRQQPMLNERFSVQSVDSGVSSVGANTTTRCSSPEGDDEGYKGGSKRLSNIYDSATTMNYSTFRKLSLEQPVAPPVITPRKVRTGGIDRPKSLYDAKERKSAFQPFTKSSLQSASNINLTQLSQFEHVIKPIAHRPQVVKRNTVVEKADALFRANVVYVTNSGHPSPEQKRNGPTLQATPCKIRSPILKAKPIAIRPISPRMSTSHSTWHQSQPL